MSSVSTVAGPNSITVGTSGAVGLEASGLPSLLPYLTSGTASTGTLVVTPATSADAVNLAREFSQLSQPGRLGQRDVYRRSDAQRHELSPGRRRRHADLSPSALTGSMGLVVNGPPTGGEVILTSRNNTYSGATVVTSGTLQVGDGVTTNGSLPNNAVTDNGGVDLRQSVEHDLCAA